MALGKRRFIAQLIYISIAHCLWGCSSSPSAGRAPITDSRPIPSAKISSYRVSPGDTLYAIAWRFDVNYKDLARINGLGGDFRIHPGQILRLDVNRVQARDKPSPRQAVPRSGNDKGLKNQSPSVTRETASNSSGSAIKWVWPATGQIVSQFTPGSGLNKGIDIRGKLGEPVVAAADGVVVYAGSGLRGYGKLLIVKHSEKLLSAYAHNRVLHVAEGDKVSAGGRIAEIGYTEAQSTRLHFEIRLDGAPVNPLDYLPRR